MSSSFNLPLICLGYRLWPHYKLYSYNPFFVRSIAGLAYFLYGTNSVTTRTRIQFNDKKTELRTQTYTLYFIERKFVQKSAMLHDFNRATTGQLLN
ncbi:hypothetical protein QE152_g13654 [Popillia japonica]|uniref:Uncharacterized protein n=1 Tax=Popillia japonica TaxID=7064 RepID=A0AAW1LC43_POPJA